MKIVFIGSRDISLIGGIETYMLNLCSNLTQKGHEVILYCGGKKFKKEEILGFTVIFIKAPQGKFFNKLLIGLKSTIHALIYQRNVSIYHYNAFGAGLSSVLPLLLGKKVIYQGHGFEWKREKWSSLQRKIIKALDTFVIRINKNITMVSEEQSEYVRNTFNKSSVTITPGINIPKIDTLSNETKDNILAKYDLEVKKYFLFLGRLVEEKNPDKLIKAFLNSNLQEEGIKLVIAGDDFHVHKYKKKLFLLSNNNPNIIFTGAVYGETKNALLESCLAFVLPSSLEGLPITLLEAMSFSKVCITSNIPACKEAIGENELMFSPNDVDELTNRLEKVFYNYNKLRKLGGKNFQKVKESFTWQKISDNYINYCKSLM